MLYFLGFLVRLIFVRRRSGKPRYEPAVHVIRTSRSNHRSLGAKTEPALSGAES